MGLITLTFLMLFCHIVDDFCLQTCCLNKLKQRSFWKTYDKKYEDDWIISLVLHSLEWAIAIHLPIIFFLEYSELALAISVIVNMTIHAIVDDIKANKLAITLESDQVIHILQVVSTAVTFITL